MQKIQCEIDTFRNWSLNKSDLFWFQKEMEKKLKPYGFHNVI